MIPEFPVNAPMWGMFQFLRATPRWADRDHTQQAMTQDGRLRWRVDLLLLPKDEGRGASTISVSYAGPKPDFSINTFVTPMNLCGGEFNGRVYLRVDGLREVEEDFLNNEIGA